MDQLYQGKMYFPGYFPNELRAIFREQVRLIQNAIIESEQRAPEGTMLVAAGTSGPGARKTGLRKEALLHQWWPACPSPPYFCQTRRLWWHLGTL